MTSKSAAQRRNTLDRQRRRRRRAAFERLEDRRLLTWTFSISGTTGTATSDGNADTLELAEVSGVIEYSTDGSNFYSDWGGSTLPASSSSIVNIDPGSGTTNTHTIQLGVALLSPASAIQAAVNVVNGGPGVSLTIDDSTDSSSASGTNSYAINNGTVTTPLGLNVNGPTNGSVLGGGITLDGGTAADTYNETGTRSGEPVTLTGGNGGNTFNITGSSSTTTINVGTGTNTVSVGGASGVGAQNVTGAVDVGGSGSTTVALDNLLGTNTPETVDLTATQITGVAPATVDFGGLTNISTFAFGTTNLGGATINVQGAPAVTSVVRIVDGSGGTNAINVGDATHAASALPAELFQLVSTGSATNLTVDDSANTGAGIATVTSSTVNFGATHQPNINFASASLASLTLDGGSGGNTINVTGTPASITTDINSGSGVDNVDVQATGTGGTLTIDTQAGSSANNVTLGGVAGVGSQNIKGTINVQSTGGSVALTVDDSQDTTARAVSLSNTALTGLTPATINLVDGLSALTAKGGSGGNSFTVTNTADLADVTLDTGGGADTVDVQATGASGSLTIDTQGGTADGVTLGGVAGVGAQNLNDVVSVQSTGGTVALTVDDSQDTTARSSVSLYQSQLSGLTPQVIDFNNVASMTVLGGSGGNTVTVLGTAPSAATFLDAGSGNDSVVVQGTSSGGALTVDTQGGAGNDVTLGGATGAGVGNLQGTINVKSSGGTVALTIDDSQAMTARSGVTLDNTQIANLGSGTITYANLGSLTFDGGSGGNSITVDGTPNSITTTLDTGGGVDSVDVQATATSGTLAIDTQGGVGNGVTLGGASGAGIGNVQGTIDVQDIGGTYGLTYDDSQDASPTAVTVAATGVTGLGTATINVVSVPASLTVLGGSGGNTFTVTGTPDGTATTLDTGAGDDNVTVEGTGSGGSLTIDTQGDASANNVTLGGVIGVGAHGLQGPVTVRSTGGTVALTVDDSQDSVNRSGINLNATQLSGLTPSTIGFNNLSALTVDFSSGTDTATVVGTPAGVTPTLTFSASTSNALTLGSPTVAAATLGSMTLNGTFGLTIDDSADNAGGTITFQGAGISFGAAPLPTFSYFGDFIEGLTIDGPATAAETVDVAFSPYLPMGTQILLAMGSSTSNAVEIGTGGLGATRLNGVTVTGTTALTIDDTNSTGAHTATITSSSLDFGTPLPKFDYGGATLTGLTYDANASGGTADVQGSPNGTSGLAPITLAMGTAAGSSVNLGNRADALGNVTVTTDVGGSTSLVVDDTSGAGSWTYSVTATDLSIAGGPTFTYGGASLSGLQLHTANNGGNTVNVTGTPVLPMGQPLTIAAFAGTGNAVNLGDATHAASSLGDVSVGSGSNGPLALTVDDTFNSAPADVSIGATSLSFGVAALPTFDYSGAALASLTVDGGSGGNTFTVTDTPGGIATDLNSGGAIDNVQVQATGAGGTLNIDTQGGLSADTVTLGGAPGVGAQGLLGTINVQSTGGAAVLDVNDGADATGQSATLASLSPTEATLTGLAPATIDVSLAAVGNMGIATGSAANSLTVDCTAGDPLPAILRFTGAGGNTLDLHGSGANFTDESYLATGPGAGSLNFDGAHQVLFSQLVPIDDTVPVSTFTFSAPAGSTAFNVVDGPTADGFATTQVASPTNAFERINFANKPTATLNASDSGTAILLNNPDPGAGLQTLTIHGGAGNDSATIQAAPTGVTTALDLGGGDDQASLTPAALPATGSLAIDGGTGTNAVTADAATTTADTGTAGNVGFGTGGAFAYQNVQTLDVTALNSPPVLAPGSSLSATVGQALNNAVVATFTDPDSSETAGAYQATISWGDGTTSAGTIVADPNHAGTFDVVGSHTYATSGTKTTGVSLTDQGGTFPSMAGSTAVSTTLAPLASPVTGPAAPVSVQATPQPTPNPTPPDDHVTGSVDDGPGAGPMMPDGFEVTRDDTPSFRGTAGPGALVQVFATGTFPGAPHVLIASTTADPAGHWSATSFLPLPDGGYTLSAAATPPPAGLIVGPVAQVDPVSASIGGLVVDTHGPVVDAIAFDRLHGRVMLTFQDGLTGLDPATLANPASYQVTASPLTAAVHVPKTITVTHVAVGPIVSPTAPVTVVLTLNNGRLLRGGRYTFQVLALGLRDMAGNPLNGAFTGTFPTGGGLYTAATTPGGSNFLAQITTFHRRVFPAVPVTTTTAHITRARSLHLTSTTRIPQAPGHVHDAALAALSSAAKHRLRRR